MADEPYENEVGSKIINACYKIHSKLGPGLLESVYETCLAYELRKIGYDVISQMPLPVVYDGIQIDNGYRLDLLVEKVVIVELKSVEQVLPVHTAQLLSYLRLSGKKLGYLLNFNVAHFKNGIHRRANGL